MRSTYLRVLSAGVLVVLFAWVVTWSGINAQVQTVPAMKAKAADKKGEKKEDRPPDEDNIPFSFPYDRDAKSQLTAVRDYLNFKNKSEIPWNKVCPLLQDILEARSDSFFNVVYTAGGEKKINRISVKTEANRIIAEFPPEGREFYQQAFGQTASSLLDEAIRANYDIPMLADISQKYFHTKAGAEATILLGTIQLERGNFLEAAYAFERILARPGSDELITPRTLFKASLAFKRSGDPKHTDIYKTTLASLQKTTSKDGLTLGRKTYTFEQLKTEIDRALELIRPSSTVGEWSMRGGNPARSGTIEGGPPFLDPIFRCTMFYTGEDEGNLWIKGELDKEFNRDPKNKTIPLPAFFPITTPEMVLFRTYHGVYAVALRDQVVNGRVVRAGELRWRSKTAAGTHQLMTTGDDSHDIDMKQNVSSWWETYKQTGVKSVLYENPLIGSLSHDGQNVYFVDDVAIPPPPVYAVPEWGINPLPQYRHSGDLADFVRAGRLAAVSLRTGSVVWDLGRLKDNNGSDPNVPAGPPLPNTLNEDEADKTTNAFQLCLDAVFLGAPLAMNGKLYVLIEQAGVIRLLCLDPKLLIPVPARPYIKVPNLVWSQKLGRANSALPQDSIRRYQGIALAASDGIIICPTNSGAIVAVDSMSHSLLWAHAYRKLEVNTQPRQPMFTNNGPILPIQLPVDRWRAGGAVIASGRIILTAYDSNKLECLDLRSGKVLWSTPRESSDLYVGGIVNDRVIVVGKSYIKAYHLTGEDPDTQRPKEAFERVSLDKATPTGHGIGGKGVFYIPLRQETAGNDTTPPAEIWALNVESGQIISKTAARKRNDNAELGKYGLGNLVFQDGLVFAQSAYELTCYPQLEQKKAEMDRLLKANPKDPQGLLNRGELLLDDGKLLDAIADFKEAEKNNLPEEKRPQLREKKYVAYTELLRSDFKTGEKYLDEYTALCEVPIEPGEPAEDKVLRLDETARRQRLRQVLLAKGRESQGRLGEAFDHYLALASLGEVKKLEDMPDEPNIRMLPDVWARGRIENMIRKSTDPNARKMLEERVQKEWDAVKNRNDLTRLRQFVAVFGPYFTVGAEAQFQLADKLLETNKEAESREAQSLLAQLRATADDPIIRARAIESLAQVMIKNQFMEDAVGLYLQLGKEYPDVVIRNGKTGRDFMTDLLTDKRKLLYLEPSRFPLPTRVKAELRDAVPAGNFASQFEIEPGGDFFPMYRRYRFVIDQFAAGDGSWSLRALDRATGAEKAKFTGLIAPQMYNAGSIPFSKFVQGNGQLLLIQLGSWVYCLDLAEKKEPWKTNLLGSDRDTNSANANQSFPPPDSDGDIIVRYDDGYIITLGKATVLQAGYAALLTRDGLEVVEPLSRKQLWIRRGIPTRTHLYGDARYIVLIEMDTMKKPVATKLLRAVDGVPVEGSPDSGRILALARSYQIIGKNVLLVEGSGEQQRTVRLYDLATGKDIWKKEYDSKAVPIKTLGNDHCGYIKANGEADIIETRTGRVVVTLKIDAKNLETDLKPCTGSQLFMDADRFYLVLDRDPGTQSTNGSTRQPIYSNTVRTTPINGPIYAFDRFTGKRLWSYGDGMGLFENQLLILEQFAELPVIVVASPMQNQARQFTQPVVILEKARGRIIFDRPINGNYGNYFYNINIDTKNSIVQLNRNDMQIRISPDDSPGAK
jgi:outer membrane protein assembly factor BamB